MKRVKKPVMTQKDRDLRVAIAGREAVVEAGRKGADPGVLRTLAKTAKGDALVKAPALNVMVALDGWWQTETRKSGKASAVLDMAANAFCFQCPDEAILKLDEGEDAFLRAAKAHSAKVPMDQLRALAVEIAGHIATLFPGGPADEAEEEEPGKPKAAPLKKGG